MESFDLPLFPLGTLLVPDMVLVLHIFEPRYRQMIGNCLQTDRRFGVVLIREGDEVGAIASAYDVGTIAEITDTRPLDEGRIDLLTEGRQRFRIVERYYDRAYLHGAVELLDEPVGVVDNASLLADETRALTFEYVQLLLRLADQEGLDMNLPPDPVGLSYRIANLLQQVQPAPPWELQALLEADSAEDRLRREAIILRREYTILDRMSRMQSPEERPYFNPN